MENRESFDKLSQWVNMQKQILSLGKRKKELSSLLSEKISKRLEMVFAAEKAAIKKAQEELLKNEAYTDNEQIISLMRDEWLDVRDSVNRLSNSADEICKELKMAHSSEEKS